MNLNELFGDAAEKNFVSHAVVKNFETISKNDVDNWEALSSLTIKNCEKLTLTTSIKDRLEFFKNSLPNWLKFPFKKIIILDWDSSENIKEFIDSVQDGRIVFARVENEPEYRHSAARNFKMRLVENDDDIVLSIDCDVMLSWKFLNNIFIKRNVIYTVNPSFAVNGTVGTSIFTKGMYFSIGGADEKMCYGWGREDVDLFDRMSLKYNCVFYSQQHLYHQPHGDNLRVKFTKEKNKWVSNAKNMNTSKLSKHGILNVEYTNPYKIYMPNGVIRSFND